MGVNVVDDHTGTGLGEPLGDGPAYSVAGSCYHDGLAFVLRSHGSLPLDDATLGSQATRVPFRAFDGVEVLRSVGHPEGQLGVPADVVPRCVGAACSVDRELRAAA